MPAVKLRNLTQFQKWGQQKAPPNLGRLFSFGQKRLPDIVQESEDPLVLREVFAKHQGLQKQTEGLVSDLVMQLKAAIACSY